MDTPRYDMTVVVDGQFRSFYRNITPFRVLREMQWASTWHNVKWDVYVEPIQEN